jgi:uncharacterized phage infection (PIP) family protein YhgE
METAREGMHAGAYQLSNAVQDLQTALTAAKDLQHSTKRADLKAALADVIDGLDDAGASIADFTSEPPELAEFRKEIETQEKERREAVDGANDALHDVNDASGNLDEFSDKPDEADAKLLNDLNSALDDAVDDLTEGIKALGGKVEEDDSEPVPVVPGSDVKDDQPKSGKLEP